MKKGFFFKLALDGIRKNRKLYFPYILTGMVMTMMYYILAFLAASDMLEHMKGGGVLRTMLPLGCNIITIFALLFLFYSNSFLIRQRNKEFGLYNILGMGKGNLVRIIFWENLLVFAISVCSGLVLGVVCSKLAELGMVNLLQEEITYRLYLDWDAIGKTLLIFAGIYFLLLLNSSIKVLKRDPLELLRSSNVGEKPPKANWLLAVLGVILLAAAYYIAVTLESPLEAVIWFFVAVAIVILATYLLFISGSVAFCRLLQRNKRYYYKANHFVSVSSMVYRMKRNGAGLASICILLTMVLVTLSSTLSLYIGAEDSLMSRYPSDIALRLSVPNLDLFNEESFSQMRSAVQERVSRRENEVEYSGVEIAGLFTENGILIDQEAHMQFDVDIYENVGYLQIIALEDYNRIMGTQETLEADECLIYGLRTEFTGATFSIEGGGTWKVKAVLEEMFASGYSNMQVVPTITLVTNDLATLVQPLLKLETVNGNSIMSFYWSYSFDMDADPDAQIAAYELLRQEIDEIILPSEDGSYTYLLDGREMGRKEFYGLYGGLFFVGILLSIVFLFAAVLIIYYKQISEGYEDQKRFEVMKKVGMTNKDIRQSVNSQILTVFFLPLIFAGLHLVFAFHLIWLMLQLFSLRNISLVIFVTTACFLMFGILYAIVYKLTAGIYYRIVSGAAEN